MDQRRSDKVSGDGANQSRREALKKFGKYAAVAPAAMVLLHARPSHARGGAIIRRIFERIRERRGSHNHY